MGISIDLDDIGGSDFNAALDAASTQHPLDEIMSRALEASRGIEVEFSSKVDAEAMRFRFYRRIKALRKHGIKSFDCLVIGLKDTTLTLTRMPTFSIKEL